MSRVFLAHDVDLEREVVVKVLPPDLAAGVNTDRFRREIQLVARLQHPHIVPLLSAGAKDGLLYYTMPFIAGENLRARLSRMGELPVSDAARVLREVADALDYAHEQGVAHRDIKPENILFSGNHALVTDFGVSKALSNATTANTVAGGAMLTSRGIALGTPTYMSPEQVAADPSVDHRADIYSLGVVGYELLAGRPPFTAMTQQQVLSAQVSVAPIKVTHYRPNIPPVLADTIMRCLEKHPADRWQTAGELRTQLETVSSASGANRPGAKRSAFLWTRRRAMLIGGAATVLVAGALVGTIAFKNDEAGFTIGATRQLTNLPGVEVYPAVSPDGKMFAYVRGLGGKGRIFSKQVSGGRAIPLTDSTVDAFWPRWKPDGSAILYTAGGSVYTIPPLGGSPTTLLRNSSKANYAFCDWSPAGTSVICGNRIDGALYRFDANSGNVKRITPPSPDVFHSIAWSPDGRHIAYVSGNIDFVDWGSLGNLAASSIWVMSPDGGDAVRISDASHLNMSPAWAPDSKHVLFVSDLGGARDIYSEALSGSGTPRGSPVRLSAGLNPHTISLSGDGRSLVYSAFETGANVWSAPLHGADPIPLSTVRQTTFGNQTVEAVSVSHDGKWLAYDSNLNGNGDIYKVPVGGGDAQQLTRDPADDFAPQWSPDGTEIAFHSFRNGTRDIFVISADGTRTETVVAKPNQEAAPQWSPSGHSIIYGNFSDSLFIVSRTASGWGQPAFVVRGWGGAFSPDDTRLAFESFQADGNKLLVAPVGQPAAAQVLTGDICPFPGGFVWSTDSKLIYYCAEHNGLRSFRVMPSVGGPSKLLLELSDPLRQLYRGIFAVDQSHIYFTVGSRESDIWVMELNRK